MNDSEEVRKLKAQLAEAQALLRDIKQHGIGSITIDGKSILERIDGPLSAGAEPSAPVEIDERAAFESWYIRDVGIGLANLSRINSGSRAYEDEDAMAAWEGWQARAALDRQP